MAEPKVLVAAPLFDGMKYCLKEFLERVRNLSYENYEILLVDNSRENDFYEDLKKEEGIIVLKDGTNEDLPVKRLVSNRNKILEYTLERNYDFVFMLDADVIPPQNAVKELLECNKDIVSGLYWNNFMSSSVMKWLPVAWMPITEKEFEEIKKQIKLPLHFTHKDMQRHMTQKEAESGKLFEVLHPSAGCMLLSRKVFEQVRYGVPDGPANKSVGDDIYFIKKARESEFKVYVDTKIKCEHIAGGKYKKDRAGNLLHPLQPEF